MKICADILTTQKSTHIRLLFEQMGPKKIEPI